MPRWTSADIPWNSFDRSRLDPDLLTLVRAASLTERNAACYTQYLKNVFADDPEFGAILSEWQLEEEQHGSILGRYAELADPTYDFAAVFEKFRDGYAIPTDLNTSVRGSRVGELVSRCVVETGTSSFYSALSEAADEPVLREICRRIAADEVRHYRTFLDGLRAYQQRERTSAWARIRVMIQRVRESDDDELAFAYHCANEAGADYDRNRSNLAYARRAYSVYRPHHADRIVRMILKACGLPTNGWLGKMATFWTWRKIQSRAAAV